MMAWQPRRQYDPDEPQPALGPGISRPLPTETARLYRLRVKIPSMQAMTITIPAPSRGKAILYCQNRWPGCTAETIDRLLARPDYGSIDVGFRVVCLPYQINS